MNPITPNTEPEPPIQRRKAVAGSSLKIVLTGLLLAVTSVAENVSAPEFRVELDGRVGDPSVLAKRTVPA